MLPTLRVIASTSVGVAILVVSTPNFADDSWTQFRGPGARGVSSDSSFPDTWDEQNNITWAVDIPGRGWSSPIVIDGKVLLTTVTRSEGEPEHAKPGLYFGGDRNQAPTVAHEWRVMCLSLENGSLLWQRSLNEGVPQTSRHIKNSYASETPVTDGTNVYVLFGDVGIYCLTLQGELVWSKELPACKTRHDWGTASSPVLHGNRIYFISDNEDDSYLAALDKRTGEEIWKTHRDEKSNWATPFVWENETRTEIITPGTGKVRSYDLEGNLLYEFGGCSSITIATPYTVGDLLYVSSGYVLDKKRPIFAIRPGASGDISLAEDQTSNEFIAWCRPQAAPYNPSTLAYDGLLYVLHDRGFTQTLDAMTGAQVRDRSRIPNGRSFTASPWAANGKVFYLNEFGTTFVFEAGANYRLLHTNQLNEDEMYMASPALTSDKLLIRSSKRLYCIGSS